MRTPITIIIIIIILLGGSLASYRYVETNTQIMGALLESVEASITVQKWEGAQAELNIAEQNWNNDNKWWSIILDHQEIDNININMKRLEKYLGVQDVSQSLGEVTTLKLLFEHIFDTELFTLKNIF
ncbi:MAG: hypothetical protein APF81_26695 [Desulfosporosinus sp. BRH_c37]|nr:MAG: hypothetical protein APF81_26695 [Desulfosporosinus sp. BRH_c37]